MVVTIWPYSSWLKTSYTYWCLLLRPYLIRAGIGLTTQKSLACVVDAIGKFDEILQYQNSLNLICTHTCRTRPPPPDITHLSAYLLALILSHRCVVSCIWSSCYLQRYGTIYVIRQLFFFNIITSIWLPIAECIFCLPGWKRKLKLERRFSNYVYLDATFLLDE